MPRVKPIVKKREKRSMKNSYVQLVGGQRFPLLDNPYCRLQASEYLMAMCHDQSTHGLIDFAPPRHWRWNSCTSERNRRIVKGVER
jgi:hypothetical protein